MSELSRQSSDVGISLKAAHAFRGMVYLYSSLILTSFVKRGSILQQSSIFYCCMLPLWFCNSYFVSG